MRLLHHGTSEYRPNSILGPAYWPHFDLLVILRGSFLFDLPRADLKAIAGDALVVPKGVRFRCQSRSFGGTIWVHHFIPGKAPDEEWIHHLPRTHIPIKQISREAGYGETSAFHHAFRKVTGCPPAKYRRDHPKVV